MWQNSFLHSWSCSNPQRPRQSQHNPSDLHFPYSNRLRSQRIDVNLLNKFSGKANCVLEVLIRTIDKGDYRIIHKKCSSYCETVSIEPPSSSEFSFRSIMFNAERKINMFTMLADDFFILHRGMRRRSPARIVSGFMRRTPYISPAMENPQSSQAPMMLPGQLGSLRPSIRI